LGLTVKEQIKGRESECLTNITWDLVIIGAGIMGSQLFRNLSQSGLKILLLDKNDFGGGTSSNSGMLIWGGLLYLKSRDIKSILKFSKARNEMIKSDPNNVEPFGVKYIRKTRASHINIGLSFYRFIGEQKLSPVRSLKNYYEQNFLPESYKYAYQVQEAHLKTSDARFVLDIIFSNQNSDSLARNYLEIIDGNFRNNEWILTADDKILNKESVIRSKHIVNCCGAATELLNEKLGNSKSPFKHIWSKGVYLCLDNSNSASDLLVFDLEDVNDVITYSPHRKLALWGPTEERIHDLSSGFIVNENDINWLKERYLKIMGRKLKREDVISVRSGVRPLAVSSDYTDNSYTLGVSRDTRFNINKEMNISTVYGGKITGSFEDMGKLATKLFPKSIRKFLNIKNTWKENLNFKFIDCTILNPNWAQKNEQCWFLEDFLRRRTYLNQEISNGAFGNDFRNTKEITDLNKYFLPEGVSKISKGYTEYRFEQERIDSLLRRTLNE
jgi:glycerol-3-phosphate dehydrogenase